MSGLSIGIGVGLKYFNPTQRKFNIGYVAPQPIAAWSAAGKTNDDEDRAILKDLTGNGHDITLNGFAFSEMSGYGGYTTDFSKYWGIYGDNLLYDTVINNNTVNCQVGGYNGYVISTNKYKDNPIQFKLKIEGLKNKYSFRVQVGTYIGQEIFNDGIYILNTQDLYDKYPEITTYGFKVFSLDANATYPINDRITIELLPEYPDALVFDGVNDYGVNKNIPILTDYTFIIKRHLLSDSTGEPDTVASKRDGSNWGAFIFEKNRQSNNLIYTSSFNSWSSNKVKLETSNISWQTKNSYNGQPILSGDISDTNIFLLGSGAGDGEVCNMAFYSAYLFDRSLTEEEIKAFIRKNIDPSYLLPSEIPTPDCYYDFSLGSNDDENKKVVKDQSGNGNDAKIYNCAFRGMSGYGGYKNTDNSWTSNKIDEETWIKTYSTLTFVPSEDGNAMYNGGNLWKEGDKISMKITGIPEGGIIQFGYGDTIWINANKDGVYTGIYTKDVNNTTGIYTTNCVGSTITIEYLPEYEGALVLDGVDDYVKVEKQMPVFKTVFVVLKDLSTIDRWKYVYDGRCLANNGQVLNRIFYAAPANGTLSPNGVINKTYSTDLLKVIDHSTKVTITEDLTVLNIGSSTSNTEYSNIAIYKFLGFKEALNEDQIKAVIQKYNLLDGVDDIEVS